MNSFDKLERTVRHLEERLVELEKLEERLVMLEGAHREHDALAAATSAAPSQLLTATAEAFREAAVVISRDWGKLGTRTLVCRWLMDRADSADERARILGKKP